MPSPRDPVRRFYRHQARIYDLTRWAFLFGRAVAVEQLRLNRESRVLDVGCGTGLNIRHVRAAIDPDQGWIVGLDFSRDMLDKARKRAVRKAWHNVSLIQGDGARLPLQASFDAVLFSYSLTMIPRWEASLENAMHRLRPGGRLAVLDFSDFRNWSLMRPALKAWFRWNHVLTERPYLEYLARLLPDLSVKRWLGGWCFLASGTKP